MSSGAFNTTEAEQDIPREEVSRIIHRLVADIMDAESDLNAARRGYRQGDARRRWEREWRSACLTFPYPKSTWDINNGLCEEFAERLRSQLPGAEIVDMLDLYLNDARLPQFRKSRVYSEEPAHTIVWYRGRYYDSQNPEGVDDWAQLDTFKLNGVVTRTEYLIGRKLHETT